jgi:hypothetical protein
MKGFSVFVIIILAFSLAYGGAVITDFRAETALNRVELKWVVSYESNVKGYELLRSRDGSHYDEQVAFVDATPEQAGEKTYSYVDDKVFKSSGNTYYYKLRIVENDNSKIEYDQVCTVSPQISATRHTWGSIKAMFR